MKASKELWNYGYNENVWVGRYLNSQNLLHWHKDCELILIERGSANIVCGKSEFVVGVGAAMFIDSGTLHHIQALDNDTVILTIVFKRRLIDKFCEKLTPASPLLKGRYPILEAYEGIFAELRDKREFYFSAADARLVELIVQIFRGEELTSRQTKGSDENLKRLLDKIDSDFEFIDFSAAAAVMSMNESYFSRYFKQATGQSFSAYLNGIRVEKAVEFISSGLKNMTEIATLCGFGSIRNFNRIFKNATGYAPTNLPDGYTYSQVYQRADDTLSNPTLPECKLIESSSM